MILSFKNVLNFGFKEEIEALITTEHRACKNHKPIVILADGNILDQKSYRLMEFQLIQSSEDESDMLIEWLKDAPIPYY